MWLIVRKDCVVWLIERKGRDFLTKKLSIQQAAFNKLSIQQALHRELHRELNTIVSQCALTHNYYSVQ